MEHLLTAQQVAFFDTFGFLTFPGLMADRIGDIQNDFENIWADHAGGHGGREHDGKARSCIVPFIDQSKGLTSLLDDPSILGIAKSLLGDNFNYMGSDGNYYVGDTGWHSDGWHPKDRHIKIAFYLDEVGADSGCLRVIPGSHVPGDRFAALLSEQIRVSGEAWSKEGRDVPAFPLASKPGDVVCFNHNIKHAAFGGGHRRRMFTINLCERYPEDRVGELKDYIGGFARFWVDHVYSEQMVQTAGPERLRHLEQVMSNDGHLAELSLKARETMAEPSRG